VTEERGLFERTTLEAFQSALSWLTILRKRNASRDTSALAQSCATASGNSGLSTASSLGQSARARLP